MRKILFRGKRFDTGEWSYGSLQCFKGYSIFDNIWNNFITVASKTVGQYTDLKDKNGMKIFEGDIIKLDNDLDTKQKNFEVKFAYGQFYIGINKPLVYVRTRCEVIGNIHDNPELLEDERSESND